MRMQNVFWTLFTTVGCVCIIIGLALFMTQVAYAGHFDECDDDVGCAAHDCPAGACNGEDADCGCTLFLEANEYTCLCGVSSP